MADADRKGKATESAIPDWPAETIQAIKKPTLAIIGDSDIVTLERLLSFNKINRHARMHSCN
ncbi:MAG TPA: hypothetical protein VN373_01490 [Methanosarcina barkeri]|nr:hypothetical protein [Methanosarcina barkeri]